MKPHRQSSDDAKAPEIGVLAGTMCPVTNVSTAKGIGILLDKGKKTPGPPTFYR